MGGKHSKGKTSTARVHKFRELAKLDLEARDPGRCYSVRLRDSLTVQISQGVTTGRPQDRDRTITKKQWNAMIARAVALIVEGKVKREKPN